MAALNATVAVAAALALVTALCVRSLIREHKRGEKCECPGDCTKCRIRCRDNERYYGTGKTGPDE